MKKLIIGLSALGMTLTLSAGMSGVELQQKRDGFAAKRFGIFIHWGLYATYAQGEWFLETSKGEVREGTYAQAMHGFYPARFDAREWARTFRKAGAKYVTITSRHHDGFSLWPSKVDDGYNIANTPFKRDILGELAAACKAEGLQLNFYYSLMDWHRPDYPTGRQKAARRTLKVRNEDYASYKRFMMAQIAELLDAYHPGNIWFDGEWDHDPKWSDSANPMDWGFDEIYDLIHSKGALVANNHHHAMRDKEDIQLFERDLPGDNTTGFSAGQPVEAGRPIEQCDVIQRGVWGFRVSENGFRTAEDVVAMVARAAAKDANLLMNIGPQGDGALPAKAVEALEKTGAWFAANGESVYGTRAAGLNLGTDVVTTRKGDALYLHFLNPSVGKTAFSLDGKVVSAMRLADGKAVPVERTASGDVVVTALREKGDAFDTVVKLVVSR